MSISMFGSDGIIGNGKVLAICTYDDSSIYLLKDPFLKSTTMSISHGMIDVSSIYGIRQRERGLSRCHFDLSIVGHDVKLVKNEPGLVQRLLTEDISILQMVRLVREKLDK